MAFVGLFDSRDRYEIDRGLLGRMNDSQFHRGPDGAGIFVEPGIGLGHRRLAIIDLAGGAQPLFNEDQSVVVVYNGEIYNFRELADELLARGHRFGTRCDTEVIVHAWEEWGEACVERFRGMFAFAIWDKNAEALFLARDRLGIKPLYYAVRPDGMVSFASELKALLIDPKLSRDIDVTAVEDYFAYGYVPDPKSNLHQRPQARARPHPALAPRPERGAESLLGCRLRRPGTGTEAETCEALIEQIREAVDIRLISEVPLGAFLSGGVDSSAIVAMMAGLSSDPVNTCSISFDQPDYDESAFAAMVAERYATNHHVRRVDPDSFDLVDRLATLYGRAVPGSSAIPTYRVCGLARERVTVALSGDGGDELFAGYRRYPGIITRNRSGRGSRTRSVARYSPRLVGSIQA